MRPHPFAAKFYIALILALGTLAWIHAAARWHSSDPVRLVCYLAVATFGSVLKVRLPGITGTMSVNHVFILLAVVELGVPEAMLLGCLATIVQTLWHSRSRPRALQLAFNLASIAVSITVASEVFALAALVGTNLLLRLAATGTAYFVVNTLSVAIIVSLTEQKPAFEVWRQCYFWSFSYYLLGASVTAVVVKANQIFGWEATLLTVPVLYLVFRSYRLYLNQLENEKKHAEEVAALHLRTIQALALAIEAKDENTHNHLQRVQYYAVEIGKELGLRNQELEAVRAAALLHDIGKLAVPEHIISKPGKLTPEEFEKIKIHPTVGADILERVQFPYPVAPIVRAHHENWDGSGYPHGLRGEDIPLGARILAAVDCLDALASDRQYRRAVPLDQAMSMVAARAGSSFDPAVVKILQQRYRDLERSLREEIAAVSKPVRSQEMAPEAAPAAGFERSHAPAPNGKGNPHAIPFLSSIAAARQEVQTLFELSQELGSSLSLNETLSVLDLRLRKMIPYHAMAVYLKKENQLVPEYVQGENFQLFSSLSIPIGEGLSGWVALNHKPIVNGNPSVEFGYLNDPTRFTVLRSALAIPLVGPDGVLGVMALYHKSGDAFSRDHLRVLMAIGSKISRVAENALRFQKAEMSATTDGLTGLPNASSLFLRLDAELARSKRVQEPLTLLVFDLDGFKTVNDCLGHLQGNHVLRRVAAALRDSCREYDYVARMGGDEFVMILPGVVPEAIQHRIRVIAGAVEEIGREVSGNGVLSISVGSACFPNDGADAEELLAEADRRMYRAKHMHKQLARDSGEVKLNKLIMACGTIQ